MILAAALLLAASLPFGAGGVPVTDGAVVAKWNAVRAGIAADDNALARCRAEASCTGPAQSFLAIAAEGAAADGLARLGVINRAVNLTLTPLRPAQRGASVPWRAPLAILAAGRGGCLDYAVVKYAALLAAGIRDVAVVIVRNRAADQDHAVAAARLGGEWLILDNRWLALDADAAFPRAAPLFVLDDNGVRS